jgi:CDP-glucose 4,6-dehydratase
MKIIVTGNQGFIGYWLSKRLSEQGHTVVGIDNLSSFGERQSNHDKDYVLFKQLTADLCDPSSWVSYAKEFEADVILHLAAQAILPRCYRDPVETVTNNITSTQNVLEFCNSSTSVKSLVCVTSDKVYENLGTGSHFREEDRLGGKDAYSLSKTTCEFLCKSYHVTHRKKEDLSIQTARLGNVVGGGDWSVDRLIPDLMRSISNNKEFYIRYMDATRPFQHVSDVVAGLTRLFEFGLAAPGTYDYWNIGPRDNSSCSVGEVINLTKKHFGDFRIVQSKDIYKEDLLLAVDNSKYANKFGHPEHDSLASIDLALGWYLDYGGQL